MYMYLGAGSYGDSTNVTHAKKKYTYTPNTLHNKLLHMHSKHSP